MAKSRGISPFELALGYLKRRRYLGTAIIGATTVAQLVENIAAVRVERVSATLAAIADILRATRIPRTERRADRYSTRPNQSSDSVADASASSAAAAAKNAVISISFCSTKSLVLRLV